MKMIGLYPIFFTNKEKFFDKIGKRYSKLQLTK